jgi:hypothetical protein
MLPEFRPAHANYAFKAAMYGFEYRHIIALNLRWMRLAQDQPVTCRVALVEALAETEVPLEDVGVIVDGKSLKIPGGLKTGDYAEFQPDGPARVFDRNGVLLSSFRPEGEWPTLQAGANRVVLRAAGAGCVKFTAITVGDALSW